MSVRALLAAVGSGVGASLLLVGASTGRTGLLATAVLVLGVVAVDRAHVWWTRRDR